MSEYAYGALGMGDDDPNDPSPASPPTSFSSSLGLSFTDARSSSAARGSGRLALAGAERLLGTDLSSSTSGYQADTTETLLSKVRSAGMGGGLGASSAFDSDTRKFRSDKLSRIFRLQRDTRCYRFTLLFLSVLIVFSGYFQFDLPAITVNLLLKKLGIKMDQFATIFVGYSVSNTIVPLFSGPFFGRFGKWRGVTVIAITITIGIAIVWVGMLVSNFNVVVLGRTIYGLGGESVFVGVDILVTKWFQGAEIGFAYGLIQAAGQAGSFTALYTVPPMIVALGNNVNNVYLVSFLLSCGALAALALARILEKTAYGRKATPSSLATGSGVMHNDATLQHTGAGGFATAVMDGVVQDMRAKAAASRKEGNESASLLRSGGGGGGEGASGAEDDEEEEGGDTDVVSPELKLRLEHNLRYVRCIPPLFYLLNFLGIGHIVSLSWRFFAVMGGIICYSSAFYTFLAFGPKWLMTVYGLSEEEAGQTAGIIAIFSMILSPTSGLIMDKRGGQRFICFGAMVSACVWFAIMGFAKVQPAVCIVFAGMSYSLLPASLYPLLPEVVPDESFTIVYAVLNSAINLVFTIVLLIAGSVLGEDTSSLQALGPRGLGRVLLTHVTTGAVGEQSSFGAADPAPAHHNDVNPKNFEYVFSMFITITAMGTIFTGALAWDAYKSGIGWQPLTRKH